MSKAAQLKAQVLPKNDGDRMASRLQLFEANLLSDQGWEAAVAGCEYVLHVASPFPLETPKDENQLIKPAVEGTLRVLGFAEKAGVKRVVVTSSFAAIGYGRDDWSVTLDESCWTNPDHHENVGAYIKSKTLAERAAWDFADKNPRLELSTVNPVVVAGPILPGTTDLGSSIDIIRHIASGKLAAAPKIAIGIVDVRDVADMHILAMTKPEAAGKRFLATSGDGRFTSLQEIGQALGKNVRTVPDWLTRCLGYVMSSVAELVPELGKTRKATNRQAREVLGIDFISMEEAVRASEQSLRETGKL